MRHCVVARYKTVNSKNRNKCSDFYPIFCYNGSMGMLIFSLSFAFSDNDQLITHSAATNPLGGGELSGRRLRRPARFAARNRFTRIPAQRIRAQRLRFKRVNMAIGVIVPENAVTNAQQLLELHVRHGAAQPLLECLTHVLPVSILLLDFHPFVLIHPAPLFTT